MAVSEPRDERYTLADTFGPLHAEHCFSLDAAATAENALCERFFDAQTDGLSQTWAGQVVWCNPPYSDIGSWVKKARWETVHGLCPKVVMLLPANRTEQPWWQDYIEPVRDRGRGVATQNLRRRRKFGKPGHPLGDYPNNSPEFGLVVVIFTHSSFYDHGGDRPAGCRATDAGQGRCTVPAPIHGQANREPDNRRDRGAA